MRDLYETDREREDEERYDYYESAACYAKEDERDEMLRTGGAVGPQDEA